MALKPLLTALLLLTATISTAAPFGGTVNEIVLDKDFATPLYAATDRGLFSFESGKWGRVPFFGVAPITAIKRAANAMVALKGDRDIYVGGLGDKWRPSRSGLEASTGHVVERMLSLAVDPNSPKHLYMGSKGQGPFFSPNQGRDWDLYWDGLESRSPAAGHVTAILPAKQKRPLIIGTGGDGLFAWSEKRWQPIGGGLPEKLKINSLAEDPKDPSHLAIGTGGAGFWESFDAGRSFKKLREGEFKLASAVSIGFDGSAIAFFPSEGLVIAKDGKAGRLLADKYTAINSFAPLASGGWLAATRNDGILRINSEGKADGTLNEGLLATRVSSIQRGREPSSLLCGDSNGVFYSSDNGSTWTQRDKGLLKISPVTKILYSGESLFIGLGGLGVFLWDPQEEKWIDRGEGLGTSNTIYSLMADKSGRLFVGTEGGVLRTADNGVTWVKVSESLPIGGMWSIALKSGPEGEELLASSSSGVFSSADGGESWRPLSDDVAGLVKVIDSKVYLVAKAKEGSNIELKELGSGTARFSTSENNQINDFLLVDGKFLIATASGFWVEGGKKPIWGEAGVLALLEGEDGRLIVGTDGMGVKVFKIK